MNKTLVGTAFLVMAGALAASSAFAENTAESKMQDNQAVIQQLSSYEISGKVQDINRDEGKLTVKMYDGKEVEVTLQNKTCCSVIDCGYFAEKSLKDIKKGQAVKVNVDGNLNARNVTVYLY